MSENATAEVLNERYFRRQLELERELPGIEQDAREGLLSQPRSMPPKYFYDARGSRLFEAICETPEYYPTRLEAALLKQHSSAVIARTGAGRIVEFGSGNSRKTRWLLDALNKLPDCEPEYHAIDVCGPILDATAADLLDHYEQLRLTTHVGDYHGGFRDLQVDRGEPLLALFLGGTIGNFAAHEAQLFLSELSAWLGPEQYLLIGFDRVKTAPRLEAAYDDAQGVTAEFNLNVLEVFNRELEADFDRSAFRHQAIYNSECQQVEMYLVAERQQSVRLGALGDRLDIEAGERIRTEISRKFTEEGILDLLGQSGFGVSEFFDAPDQDYSLVLARSTERENALTGE